MEAYVIEGTISELTKKQNGISIKISGSEGYSVKQDKKKYNVVRYQDSQNNTLPTAGEVAPCYIADSQFELPIGVRYENILAQALVSGKRIRLTIPEDILTSAVHSNANKTPQDKVTSVTVLSE